MKFAYLYHKRLRENIIPFWEKYSMNTSQGKYYTCVDNDGTIYDTDKFQCFQLAQIWTLAMLYNQEGKNEKSIEDCRAWS